MIDLQHFSFSGLNNLKQLTLSERKGERWGMGELDKGGQKVQTSGYKISKYWRGNVQPDDYS